MLASLLFHPLPRTIEGGWEGFAEHEEAILGLLSSLICRGLISFGAEAVEDASARSGMR